MASMAATRRVWVTTRLTSLLVMARVTAVLYRSTVALRCSASVGANFGLAARGRERSGGGGGRAPYRGPRPGSGRARRGTHSHRPPCACTPCAAAALSARGCGRWPRLPPCWPHAHCAPCIRCRAAFRSFPGTHPTGSCQKRRCGVANLLVRRSLRPLAQIAPLDSVSPLHVPFTEEIGLGSPTLRRNSVQGVNLCDSLHAGTTLDGDLHVAADVHVCRIRVSICAV